MCFLSASLHFLDFWGSLNGLSLDFWGPLSVCAQHIWLVWNSCLHCQISEVVGSLLTQLNPSCSMVAICHHHITMLTYHTCTPSPQSPASPESPHQCGCLGCLDVLHTEGLVVLRAVLHLLLFTSFNSTCWENSGAKFPICQAPRGPILKWIPCLQLSKSPHIPTFT